MKKACLFGLSLLLCLGLIGCGSSNPQPSGSPTQTAVATDAANANAPAVSFTEEDVRAMLPMMDSVMLCLTEGAAESHTFSDASYVWSLLYYLCVNHPSVSSHIAVDDQAGTLSISAEDLLSLASACFENPSSLPAVPSDFSGIRFDSKTNQYTMTLSDRGSSKSDIRSIQFTEDHTAVATVDLIDMNSGDYLQTFTFVLAANPQAEKSGYPLTISHIE